jgi:MFS family permease
VQTAFALDAALFDLAYIAGPVIATSLAVGIAPAAAAGVMLALTGAAVVVIGTRFPREAAGTAGRTIGWGPLRSAALRRLLIMAALTNVALIATEVSLTASMRLHNTLWAIGPLLAELSVGSILGSLLLGTRAPASSTRRRLPRFLAGYTVGLAALTAAALALPLLAVATPLAGLCLGPVLATLFTAVASAVPSDNGTEAQAWLNSIMNGGAAGGAALAGLFASQPIVGLALATAAAALAALTAALMKGGNESSPPVKTP